MSYSDKWDEAENMKDEFLIKSLPALNNMLEKGKEIQETMKTRRPAYVESVNNATKTLNEFDKLMDDVMTKNKAIEKIIKVIEDLRDKK